MAALKHEAVMSLPELLTVTEFCAWARIGRTKTYEEIAAGALIALKIGRRTLIKRDDALTWLDNQPALATGMGQ
jgi:excisionase family DNA binding protein